MQKYREDNLITRHLSILIIDDDDVDRANYKRMLESNHISWEISEAMTAKDAISSIGIKKFDCILLDYQLPDMSGIELLQYIKKQYDEYVSVIMLTGHGSEDVAVKAMKEGAADYLVKNKVYQDALLKTVLNSIKILELKKIIQKQKDQIDFYRFSDSLTGLMNRHTFEEMAKQAYSHCVRHSDMLAIILIDLEQFITINDTLGRLVGDEILIEISKRLKQILPDNTIIGRWGNDEYAILLTGLDIEHQAENAVNEIIKVIKEPILVSSDVVKISANIGVAYYPTTSSDLSQLIKNASTALNQAKALGSGIVLQYSSDMDLVNIITGNNNG